MPKRAIFFVATMIALAGPAGAHAATAYVDDDAAATAGCITPDNPCATITDGVAVAGAGGTVIVDDGGVFEEQVTLAGGETLERRTSTGSPAA